ncbi:two component transcriptional regulator, winged-helix family [Thermoanaerobacter thermohydrosulfuricus WC1]|uniref:Stage 0 sporulation protein A homolog n=2 Tax=Thermoanaerobacter thermohydrosulfuricus TaxID=1516 RepID=M8DNM0_THETY|nr:MULTISPECIES: response regulator transcription factor [Thermoanaerobacter]EMT38161.1 two component transcriptional regulator, winged-helix family [Thermoanaerobacter thermohydrosulfuricus WC1]SFE57144.1 DNA-binding response regulator, OmpR family, contains REC and winged-helix (wHTH) domain [Thermoanaerobacter thermohydrosulfuricus]
MMKEKILIIEDEKHIARFLQLEFEHEGYTVTVTYDGPSGLKEALEGDYDLVLLDIMLPGIDGFEVLKKIREHSDIPVIMLTAKYEVKDKVEGLDIGADDYVTKPFSIEELFARVRAALRKKKPHLKKDVLRYSDIAMDLTTHEVRRAGIKIELTKKEFDLLEFLIKNANIALTREKILECVWGYDYYGDTNIVDVYIRYLRSKIDDPFDRKLIHTIRGVGYTLKEDKDED